MKAATLTPESATFADAVADADGRKLAVAVSVSVQSVYKWKSGKNLPGDDLVPLIAKHLGWPTVKLAALVTRERSNRMAARR